MRLIPVLLAAISLSTAAQALDGSAVAAGASQR
jgi:hypothetical protein